MTDRDDHPVRGAAQGDEDAVASFHRQVAQLARRTAGHIVQDPDAVDDIVQETFYFVLQALRAGRGPRSSLSGYVSTVARRLAYQESRLSQRIIPVEDPLRVAEEELRISECAQASDAAAVWASLPPRWRDVLWLIEVDGYSPAELAQPMKMTPNAVSSLATRARRAFRTAYLATA